MELETDKLTLDAFMTQLGTHKAGVAKEMLSAIERAAMRIKAEYGLGVDDAEYILKAKEQEIRDIGTADAVGGNRFVKSYITTISKDRDNEAVLPEGMDDTDYNRIVLYGHQYGELGMGKSDWIIPNEKGAIERVYGLIARTIYASAKANPLAEQVYQWQIEEMPMGKSIGFVPIESVTPDDKGWEKAHDSWAKRVTAFAKSRGRELVEGALDGLTRIFIRWIILEYSDVMVPCNPDAVTMARTKGMIAESEIERYTIKSIADNRSDAAVSEQFAREVSDFYQDKPEDKEAIEGTLGLIDGGFQLPPEQMAIFRRLERFFATLDMPGELKEGRVLSGKSRAAVKSAIDATQAAVDALTALLEATDTVQASAEPTDNKDLDEVTITAEMAADMLRVDAEERKAAELTGADRLRYEQGHPD